MDKKEKELHWFEKLQDEPEAKKKKIKQTREKRTGISKKGLNMDNQKLINLEKYIEDASLWIDQVSKEMGAGAREDWAWNALRGVLHGLRDRLAPEEVFDLSAQLPMLIRGLYFEGYNLRNKPEKFHTEEFEQRISETMGPSADVETGRVFKAVLTVLYDHISEGELNDIYSAMPKDIRALWDDSL